jgi:hypothetical protein
MENVKQISSWKIAGSIEIIGGTCGDLNIQKREFIVKGSRLKDGVMT